MGDLTQAAALGGVQEFREDVAPTNGHTLEFAEGCRRVGGVAIAIFLQAGDASLLFL